jgi:dipeptidyl aminopeptidase/acylaminoacyl peptidase
MNTHSAVTRFTVHTPALLLLGLAGSLAGCQSNMAWHDHRTPAQPEAIETIETVEADPIPLTPEFQLFGEDEQWNALGSLPANPIPLTGEPNSTDVSRVTFAEQGADFDPAISADGEFMVFASTQHHRNADIYIKDTGSTVLTQLTDDPSRDVMPAISPDGEWVAFASDRLLDWNIYVMPRAGGRPVQITSGTAAELHPSWSPDGTMLAYSKLGQTSGRWEIWLSDIANTATPHFIGYGLFPEWCPKPGTGPTGGDTILYQRSAERGDRAFGIWTIEYNDGKVSSPSQLIGSGTIAYLNPTWSPDGSQVVFAAVKNPDQVRAVDTLNHEDCDLWMIASDGSTMVNLTAGSSSDLMPTWGNDGNIYFVSTRTGQDNIWSIDAGEAMMAAGLRPNSPIATVHPRCADGDARTPIENHTGTLPRGWPGACDAMVESSRINPAGRHDKCTDHARSNHPHMVRGSCARGNPRLGLRVRGPPKTRQRAHPTPGHGRSL